MWGWDGRAARGSLPALDGHTAGEARTPANKETQGQAVAAVQTCHNNSKDMAQQLVDGERTPIRGASEISDTVLAPTMCLLTCIALSTVSFVADYWRCRSPTPRARWELGALQDDEYVRQVQGEAAGAGGSQCILQAARSSSRPWDGCIHADQEEGAREDGEEGRNGSSASAAVVPYPNRPIQTEGPALDGLQIQRHRNGRERRGDVWSQGLSSMGE